MHVMCWQYALSLMNWLSAARQSVWPGCQVAAVDEPKLHLWETGVMRITRHPQSFGQALWCFAHTLWIGGAAQLVNGRVHAVRSHAVALRCSRWKPTPFHCHSCASSTRWDPAVKRVTKPSFGVLPVSDSSELWCLLRLQLHGGHIGGADGAPPVLLLARRLPLAAQVRRGEPRTPNQAPWLGACALRLHGLVLLEHG